MNILSLYFCLHNPKEIAMNTSNTAQIELDATDAFQSLRDLNDYEALLIGGGEAMHTGY
jgi:precorrin-6B methylase 2